MAFLLSSLERVKDFVRRKSPITPTELGFLGEDERQVEHYKVLEMLAYLEDEGFVTIKLLKKGKARSKLIIWNEVKV
jgi:hypothetical protein